MRASAACNGAPVQPLLNLTASLTQAPYQHKNKFESSFHTFNLHFIPRQVHSPPDFSAFTKYFGLPIWYKQPFQCSMIACLHQRVPFTSASPETYITWVSDLSMRQLQFARLFQNLFVCETVYARSFTMLPTVLVVLLVCSVLPGTCTRTKVGSEQPIPKNTSDPTNPNIHTIPWTHCRWLDFTLAHVGIASGHPDVGIMMICCSPFCASVLGVFLGLHWPWPGTFVHRPLASLVQLLQHFYTSIVSSSFSQTFKLRLFLKFLTKWQPRKVFVDLCHVTQCTSLNELYSS
jgi:hypothetical protein